MAYPRSLLRTIAIVSCLGVVIAACFAIICLSSTTMSVRQADQLYSQTFQPGATLEHTEVWLATQAIPQCTSFLPEAVCYNIWYRKEETMLSGEWMGSYGGKVMAECAGLNVGEVYSLIQVNYPNARFGSKSWVRVYLFFDLHSRLLKHWVNEVSLAL